MTKKEKYRSWKFALPPLKTYHWGKKDRIQYRVPCVYSGVFSLILGFYEVGYSQSRPHLNFFLEKAKKNILIKISYKEFFFL